MRSEEDYHSLDEYMVHVAEWYDAYELAHPNVTCGRFTSLRMNQQ